MIASDREADRWRKRAACLGVDPNVFVLDNGQSSAPAKAFCFACTVTAECLEFGQTARLSGVFGGVVLTDGRASNKIRAGMVQDATPVKIRRTG